MDYSKMTAVEMGRLIRNRKMSSTEAVQECFKKIREYDSTINAFIHVCEDTAYKQAVIVQQRIDNGEELSSLAGVPMAIKDNISTKDTPTTCGSQMLGNYKPIFNATAVEKLQHAGAILLGKLNMDEFAMGGSTETSYYGTVKNPWDITCVPGGSSGGSAAAVTTDEAVYTLGTDTGGSIRQPCAFCNVTGIKPTYGSVSRYGLIAYASSLDQIGPIGRDIKDCAEILSVISGIDEKDSTSVMKKPFNFDDSYSTDLKGLKIGLPTEFLQSDSLDKGVREAVMHAAQIFEKMGAVIKEFSIPAIDYAIPAYYVIACAEAGSNLSRYDGVKYGYRSAEYESLAEMYTKTRSEGFGMEVKRRIMLGSFVLSSGYYDAYYKKALQARMMITKALKTAFRDYSLILCPTTPTPAFKIGQLENDPLKMYLQDIYTVPVNLAGLPAASLPCGFSKGMPVGMQLIGNAFHEPLIVKAAYAFQQEIDYHTQKPDMQVPAEIQRRCKNDI